MTAQDAGRESSERRYEFTPRVYLTHPELRARNTNAALRACREVYSSSTLDNALLLRCCEDPVLVHQRSWVRSSGRVMRLATADALTLTKEY